MAVNAAAVPTAVPSHVPVEESQDAEDIAAGFVRGDERCVAVLYQRWGALVHTLAAVRRQLDRLDDTLDGFAQS